MSIDQTPVEVLYRATWPTHVEMNQSWIELVSAEQMVLWVLGSPYILDLCEPVGRMLSYIDGVS